jgi:hypothetical protein
LIPENDAGLILFGVPYDAGFMDLLVRQADVGNSRKLFPHGRAWLLSLRPIIGLDVKITSAILSNTNHAL